MAINCKRATIRIFRMVQAEHLADSSFLFSSTFCSEPKDAEQHSRFFFMDDPMPLPSRHRSLISKKCSGIFSTAYYEVWSQRYTVVIRIVLHFVIVLMELALLSEKQLLSAAMWL